MMAPSIFCKVPFAVIEPEQDHAFELLVRDDHGNPVPRKKFEVLLTKNRHTELIEKTATTDSKGKATIALHGGKSPERIGIVAKSGKDRWEGRLFVTDVEIEIPQKLSLSESEESLLKMLYWNLRTLRICREFGGGLSGSRVLQVQALGSRGAFLTQIVKIGQRDEMRKEKQKYEDHYKNRITNAAPVTEYAELGLIAAIIYGDANASENLQPVTTFADYFINSEPYEITPALHAILGKGLRQVYKYSAVENTTFRSLLGRFLPENLVLSLKGGRKPLGVYAPQSASVEGLKAKKLTPFDVKRLRYDLSEGDLVHLDDFTISKMQENDLNLEDPKQRQYKVKVRYDGADVLGFSTGDRADIVARVVTDRKSRQDFAVSHCLERHKFTKYSAGYAYGAEVFPEPVALLDSILDEGLDVAYGTIHGDLHWENIMLEGPANWWLIDFGLTGDGPILFDFIKLELYLRLGVLSRDSGLTVAEVLSFEQELSENPFGYLPPRSFERSQLEKAAGVIQAVRRFALAYVVNDFMEYWKLLFTYALALGKYYPTKDKWDNAEKETAKKKLLDRAGRQFLLSLIPALYIARILRWAQACKKRPRLDYEFIPLGSRVEPASKKVALDVGNRCENGVIDHHIGKGEIDCTASIVWKHPELVTDHIKGQDPDRITWLVHEDPDFDCIASTYLAWAKSKLGYFPPGARELQKYALSVDTGAHFLETVPFPERTPYALFKFHLSPPKTVTHPKEVFEKKMQNGLQLMEFFSRLEIAGQHSLTNNCIPRDHEFWNATREMGLDHDVYVNIDEKTGRTMTLPIRVNGRKKSVPGIVLVMPQSRFFKAWARKSGYCVMVVQWTQPDKPDHRIVISVPPHIKQGLRGLGQSLEKAEEKKRKRIGRKRPGPPEVKPRWEDVSNNDPWYDGRSPAHAYTIVDSPRMGTVLSLDEVLKILEKGAWLT